MLSMQTGVMEGRHRGGQDELGRFPPASAAPRDKRICTRRRGGRREVSMIDIDQLRGWSGRTEEAADEATASPIERLAALLDHETPPWPRDALPPLTHWLYFLPKAR